MVSILKKEEGYQYCLYRAEWFIVHVDLFFRASVIIKVK